MQYRYGGFRARLCMNERRGDFLESLVPFQKIIRAAP